MQGTECGMMTPECMSMVKPLRGIREREQVRARMLWLRNLRNRKHRRERIAAQEERLRARLSDVIAETAGDLSISVERLLSKSRVARTARCRQIAMYRCRELTEASFPLIGEMFGKDHSTVMHACELIGRQLGPLALKMRHELKAA